MLPIYILILSLLLQLSAVVLAVRLITITHQKLAWTLIALAVLFMAVRRSVTLFGLTDFATPDLQSELVALTVSCLMVLGIYNIAPFVKRARDAEEFLEENRQHLNEALSHISRSEERYRALFNSGNDAVFVFDVNSGDDIEYSMFTEVNDNACHMLGYTRKELLLMTPYDITSVDLHADIEKRKRDLFSRRNRVFETVFISSQGEPVPVEVSTRFFDLQGRQTILAFARDISERKAAEEISHKFGRMLDKSANEIYIFDAETLVFVQVSQGALDNLGYSGEEIKKLHGYDLKGMSREEFEALLEPLRSGEKQQVRFITRHIRKDASEYQVEANLQLLSQETPPVVVGVITDVTERLRVEGRLREWQSEFAHASRLATIGGFSTELAHELNQPLSAIINYVKGSLRRCAQGEFAIDELPAMLEKINEQTDRAVRIMQRLREFVRYENEPCDSVDVNDVIRRVLEYMQPDINQHDIEISLELEVGLPGVCVEPLRLEQVLVNLFQNAIFAMGKQRVRQLNVKTASNGTDRLFVSVSDTGIGISNDNRQRVLEPFATTREDGLGLGLPISRSIVESYGGQLWIESSEVGQKTVFSFSLPTEGMIHVRSA
jgi:two-component system sensor kinase FixL